MRYFFALGIIAMGSVACAYTNQFTLDFNAASTTGWTDPVPNPSTFGSGILTGTDAPALSPTPQAATGFPGSGMFQLSTPSQPNGIALAVYDGTAGGSTGNPTDYSVEADVLVVVSPVLPQRNHLGLVARYNASINAPLEFFYSHLTPGQPDGYGFRNTNSGTGGTATTYGIFGGITETSNRWVHMKLAVAGTAVTVSVDRDRDGNYDNTDNTIVLGTGAPTSGKAGFFSVINDQGGTIITNQFSYFDNFKFTPPAAPAEAQDWSMYE